LVARLLELLVSREAEKYCHASRQELGHPGDWLKMEVSSGAISKLISFNTLGESSSGPVDLLPSRFASILRTPGAVIQYFPF